MFVVLNGPLGAGKSSLGEALAESMELCVFLSGDALVAASSEPEDPQEHLHSAIELLVRHHRGFGYRHFVIEHLWTRPEALEDLLTRLRALEPDAGVAVFRLTLPLDENLARIRRRASARAVDELEFELDTVRQERAALDRWSEGELGEAFSVSGPLDERVDELRERIGVAEDSARPSDTAR